MPSPTCSSLRLAVVSPSLSLAGLFPTVELCSIFVGFCSSSENCFTKGESVFLSSIFRCCFAVAVSFQMVNDHCRFLS